MSDTNPFEHSKTEMKILNDFIKVKHELDLLEKRKKKLSDEVKKIMLAAGVDKATVAGAKLSISQTQRRTVPAATKDEFVAKLLGLQKNYLVTYSIVPNVDEIMNELDAGMIDQSLVNKYINTTPIITLRCD